MIHKSMSFLFLKSLSQQCSIWDKVFKNGPIEICGTQPLSRPYHFKFFKAVFHKFHLVHP